MKQSLRYFLTLVLFIILALISERVIASSFLPSLFVPQCIFMLMVYISFHEPSQRGLFSCFLIGIVSDLASAVLLGPLAIAGIVIFLVIHFFRQHVFAASGLVISVAVFLSSILAQFIAGAVRFSFLDLPWMLSGELFAQALVSALIAPLLFPFLRIGFREHTERR